MKLIRPRINIKQKLVCYEIEIAKYKHLYCSFVSIEEAKRIIKLLTKHFNIKIKEVDFNYNSKNYGGRAYPNNKIKFRKQELNLGIICHELCHLFCYKKKIFGHKKEFYNILNEFIIFIENNLEFVIKIKKEK